MEKKETYEIDFGGHCKAKIEIVNNIPKVVAAMYGNGNSISLDDINLQALEPFDDHNPKGKPEELSKIILPTVGTIVTITIMSFKNRTRKIPGIVTEINDNDTLDVTVFTPNARLHLHRSVKYGEDVGNWTYPSKGDGSRFIEIED